MIEPYTAVGLIPTFWGIRRRQDMERNLEHLEGLTHAAVLISGLDIPVRLVAIPEGALQGFTDEVFDLDHAEFARECAIDIPGPETDRLGHLARDCNVFLMPKRPIAVSATGQNGTSRPTSRTARAATATARWAREP